MGNGIRPLEQAAAQGRYEMTKLLLKYGADVNLGDPVFNQRPLHRACAEGQLEIVQLLLRHGAKVNQPDGMGQRPLCCAAEHGRYDVIQFLLEKGGAKPSLHAIYEGKTPKQWALMNGHTACASIL